MIIKIKTSATLEIDPDYMKIEIILTSLNKEKEIAINNVIKNYNSICQYFNDKKKDNHFETISYEIKDKYNNVSYQNPKTKIVENQNIFQGYLVKQIISIEFPIDILFATSLIANLSKKDEIYVNIRYYLKDVKQFQDKVITKAIENAKEKALVIASSFLKNDIQCQILDYTYNPYDNYSRTAFINKVKVVNTIEEIAKTITPKKIQLTEDVYSEWKIN